MAYSTYGALVDLQAQAKTSRRAAKSWPVFRRHCSARNHNRAAVKLDKMTTTNRRNDLRTTWFRFWYGGDHTQMIDRRPPRLDPLDWTFTWPNATWSSHVQTIQSSQSRVHVNSRTTIRHRVLCHVRQCSMTTLHFVYCTLPSRVNFPLIGLPYV